MPVFDRASKIRGKKKAAAEKRAADDEATAAPAPAAEAKAADSNKESDTGAVAPAGIVMQFNEPSAWVERMALTGTKSLPSDLAPDDDPKREEVFIQHALLSVLRGLSMLEKANVPWRRPADYFAEMFKDDVHMQRVRESINKSKSAVEQRAQRRAMKDQKKFGKEVQAEVLRQRAKHKRDLGDRLQDWKKKRRGGDREELDNVIDNDDDDGNSRKKQRTEGGGRGRGRGGGGRGGGARPQRAKNLRPGGPSKGGAKRPGKNARRRQ